MNRMNLATNTDDQGVLRIQIPGPPNRYEVQVTLVWTERASPSATAWPSGWIAATAGSIDDPTFRRPPQGDFERRNALS